jgi:hypothetical protein
MPNSAVEPKFGTLARLLKDFPWLDECSVTETTDGRPTRGAIALFEVSKDGRFAIVFAGTDGNYYWPSIFGGNEAPKKYLLEG